MGRQRRERPARSSGSELLLLPYPVGVCLPSGLQEQHGMHEDHPFLVWGDALGVGAFAVIGCQNGLRKGACLMSGGRQGVGGGAGRAGRARDVTRPTHDIHHTN